MKLHYIVTQPHFFVVVKSLKSMLHILEVQSPSKDQGIVESSKAESSDSDDDFPLVLLVPQRLEKETSQGTEDKEMLPPPTEDIRDYSDPIPDMQDLIVRAAETLDNMTNDNCLAA